MKFDLIDIYQGRIEQIDKQLYTCIKLKRWGKVNQLRTEKESLLQRIKEIQAREG